MQIGYQLFTSNPHLLDFGKAVILYAGKKQAEKYIANE